MFYMLFAAIASILYPQLPTALEGLANTSQKESDEIPKVTKDYLSVLGYPNATVVPAAYTNSIDRKKGLFVTILRTNDPSSKVAAFYEKQLFFPPEGPFQGYLRLHPVTGNFYENNSSINLFYHRNKQEGLYYYSANIGEGNLNSITITATNGSTTIIVQQSRILDTNDGSMKEPDKQ